MPFFPELLMIVVLGIWLWWIGRLVCIATADLRRDGRPFACEGELTRADVRLLRQLHIRP